MTCIYRTSVFILGNYYGSQQSAASVNPYGVYGSQPGHHQQASSSSHYGSYGVPSSKLALSPDGSSAADSSSAAAVAAAAAASIYGDPSVVAGIGAMPLSQLQSQVSSATNLSHSVSLDSVNSG